MRIDPAASLQNALLGLLRQGKHGPAPAFKPDPAPPAAAPSPVTSSSAPNSLAMLVAVAAQAPGMHRPALRRAERGIDALGRLHRALLTGAPPAEALDRLRAWSGEDAAAEGELAELLREVELRVLVELAKAER